MKIRKKDKTKPKPVVVGPCIEDELIESSDLAVPDVDFAFIEEAESKESDYEDSEIDGFKLEFKSRSGLYSHVPRVIELRHLDPEKVYGVETLKKGFFNIRQVRPASGLELQRRWKDIFDFGAVHFFPNRRVREGNRLLKLPNDLYVSICTWHGPKHRPEGIPPKRKIRFKKVKPCRVIIGRKVKFRKR